ncbi:Uncharacterized membrane protein [Chitinophaga terrae (ex Kim and Jung 2007)]|uniref:Uncharacterized membrane protein n=1 Tax=Chitinophaga terrae (ex Kim and Jung 2007) TaxID=408074 RepID=A0A1H4A241_9BACT|nr:DUF4126 family protein [Chitinophaga terrae (ex Kim and Jung 2007)]MDQ0106068.1 putative membrane protein [Chitinophaga terrae (ex Kim and Jung 2007)]GEP90008.1 hypothetical protein CTE07_16530 [Chitinophaga terrae (ex Kim and Jung 2007)]SEA30036.1 Uncharacterized membrane protein [Chitinophaga terrae (ex Kim and Jung 2007)]
MSNNQVSPLSKTIGLGIVSGMRSAFGPAFASYYVNKHPSEKLRNSPLKWMQKDATMRYLQTMAAGELVVDKASWVGNRTSAPGLTGRIMAGALAGATIYQAKGGKSWKGAIIGAIAATAATFLFFHLRKYADRKLPVKDRTIGGLEDALAVGVATLLTRK